MKKQAFPFLADPPVGQTYHGISQYPGFHTTTDLDIAAAYAIGRVSQSFEYEAEDGKHYVTDYPVLVALDMGSYEPHTDYDAEKVVKEAIEVNLDIVIEDLTDNSTDEEILEELNSLSEGGEFVESSIDNYSTALDLIGVEQFMHFNNPLHTIVEHPNGVNIVRDYMQGKPLPPDLLMDAADQYRYVEDIDTENIVSVYYVKPVADVSAFISWNDPEFEKIEEQWEGFSILTIDDFGYNNLDPTLIWENSNKQEPLREEFHGTTYERLLSAAPELANILPLPPTPPYDPEE